MDIGDNQLYFAYHPFVVLVTTSTKLAESLLLLLLSKHILLISSLLDQASIALRPGQGPSENICLVLGRLVAEGH